MYEYQAVVVRVVDGDTVDCHVDLGFYTYTRCRFRLLGIDTPERGEPGYREAKDALEKLVGNKQVTLHSTKTGKYGRWLAKIFVGHGERSNIDVCHWMLMQGLAKPYR